MSDDAVPQALEELFSRWVDAGRPPQTGTVWPTRSWTATFPEYGRLLDHLPSPLGRVAVTEACAGAASTPEDAARAFIVAMIWGYGRVGYGPFRTARVLHENPGSGTTLQEAARRVQSDGGPAAFQWLADHRLHGLGVAFATKYLFFCGDPNRPEPALILDRLVGSWLGRNTGWSPRLDWHLADYRKYVTTVVRWAAQLDTSAADVEYLIFTGEVETDPASQWRQVFSSGVVAAPNAPTPEETAVLEALDEAAEAFAALPGGVPGDNDDFERGLRELRRIVLTRGRSAL